MPLNVQVALVANPDDPFKPGPIDNRFYEQLYGVRKRVSLTVEADMSLAAVLEEAAAAMGLQPPADYWQGERFDASHLKVLFYKQEDEHGPIRRSKGRLLLGELTLTDRFGRAIFGVHDLRTVRLEDLVQAASAGTIEGDPLRPYLVLDEGWGDAPPVDWATVQAGLEVAWEVTKAIAVVTGATTGAVKARGWLLERLSRARESLSANPEWAQRGYRPDQFESLLANREWKTGELARLLGCTNEQAEGALWILGYVFDEDEGTWKFVSEDAEIDLSLIVNAIGYAAHQGADWQSRFHHWMEQYLEDGVAPPLETLDPRPQDGPLPEWKPTVGERIDGWLERLRSFRSPRS